MHGTKSPTYVGDDFTLSFLKAEKNPLGYLEGEQCKLIGFKKDIKVVLNHQVNAITRDPGFYETLGDPLVRLGNSNIIRVALLNLVPIGYSFNDRNPKNTAYLRERKRHRFIRELPLIPYNIGDKILIAQHQSLYDDIVSEILDIEILPSGVFYLIENNDAAQAIRSDKVISLIERGELSELERMGNYFRAYELMKGRTASRTRYADEENICTCEGCERDYDPEDNLL